MSWLPPDVPKGYVRLVYCLGYGEDRLLNRAVTSSRNSGTPQFWKIFHACLNAVICNNDFGGVQASRSTLEQRIPQKIRLLQSLRAAGVWLVDASIAALYVPRQPKPHPHLHETAIEHSWDLYTGDVVAEAQPQAIICIGHGVERILRSRIDRLGIPWLRVPQPNARLSSKEHFAAFATYRSICEDPRRVNRL